MSYKLFLDDERNPSDVTWVRYPLPSQTANNDQTWVICRSFWDFKSTLMERGLPPYFVSFDHDLGREPGRREFNGTDCAEFLIRYCKKFDFKLPDFVVHSKNPVGAQRINLAMHNAGLRK